MCYQIKSKCTPRERYIGYADAIRLDEVLNEAIDSWCIAAVDGNHTETQRAIMANYARGLFRLVRSF